MTHDISESMIEQLIDRVGEIFTDRFYSVQYRYYLLSKLIKTIEESEKQ